MRTDHRHAFDLEAPIASHPWPAIGVAVALGAFVGFATRRPRTGARSLGGAMVAGAGAIVLRLIRSYALEKLAGTAKSWIDERARPTID